MASIGHDPHPDPLPPREREKGIDSVLLIAFGGPERPEDVRPFLQAVTAGRPIPPERLEEVAHHDHELSVRSSPLPREGERAG